jgi:hypothetical protein
MKTGPWRVHGMPASRHEAHKHLLRAALPAGSLFNAFAAVSRRTLFARYLSEASPSHALPLPRPREAGSHQDDTKRTAKNHSDMFL